MFHEKEIPLGTQVFYYVHNPNTNKTSEVNGKVVHVFNKENVNLVSRDVIPLRVLVKTHEGEERILSETALYVKPVKPIKTRKLWPTPSSPKSRKRSRSKSPARNRIKTKSRFLKSVFSCLNIIKIPFPNLEVSEGKIKFNYY